MDFERLPTEVSALLELSWRGLRRRFERDDDDLLDLRAGPVDARRVAVDEDGKVLVWRGAEPAGPVLPSPASDTPAHFAEPIRAATDTRALCVARVADGTGALHAAGSGAA